MKRRWRRWLLAALLLPLALLGAERVAELLWPYPLDRLRALPRSTVITASDGTWLQVMPTPAGERALPLPWAEASSAVRAAVLAGEDARFFAHDGVDFVAAARALFRAVQRGRIVSGASTLTMQVVRIVEPRSRTFGNKLIEMFRARQLERLLDKEAIATVWLEQVPMGGTLRGFEAAAWYWYGRSARELDAGEAAALAAMVPAPSRRHPVKGQRLVQQHRNVVLSRMAANGLVPASIAAAASALPVTMTPHPWPWRLPHLCAAAVAAQPRVSMPTELVTSADLELGERLQALATAPGFPGSGLAIVVLDRADGAVLGLQGGRSPTTPLDAARRRRCVGSTLKPFLYAAAFHAGIANAATLLSDEPIAIGDWTPANFDRAHAGRVRVDDALATSGNIAAVRCLQAVGIERFAALLTALGLPVPANGLGLDAVLGTVTASPLELARAWQRFCARPETVGLDAADRDQVLAAMSRASPVPGGLRAGAFAWKSGTSSGRRDAWGVGVTDQRIVVVWLGNLDGRGDADLVGMRSANVLLARVVAIL
ncbi:MAG: transglycosylase domain-containing protein [Planctomycetes bacterium]|nr:transglycosylase domain-containing protein [Planctomycetota bacterium]